METSSTPVSRDNSAMVHSSAGAHAALDDTGARVTSLNLSSSSNSSNGNSSGTGRQQQSKSVHSSVTTASGKQNQRTSSSQANNTRPSRATSGVELKSRIIDFMRDRPHLWNKLDPNYSDIKKREAEFSLFSQHVGHSVVDIKRVWHVLRTNFFRAHKNQDGCGDNPKRCWRYYQSMRFILIDSPEGEAREGVTDNNDHLSINNDSSSSVKNVRETRQAKVLKEARESRRLIKKTSNQVSANHMIDNGNNSAGVPSALLILPAPAATPSISMSSDSNLTLSSDLRSNPSKSFRANLDNDHETTSISPPGLVQGRPSTFSAFDGGMSQISFDDDEHLYARSLTATLKKFDPTTREVIKLKFQEIIVEYMQKQQQQLQLQLRPHQNPTQQPRQGRE